MHALSTGIVGATLFAALAWHSAFYCFPSSWVWISTLEVQPIPRHSASVCRERDAPPILLHVDEALTLVGEEGAAPLALADAASLRSRLRALKEAAPHRTHVILHVADDATYARVVEAVDAAAAAELTGVEILAGPQVVPFDRAAWSRPTRADAAADDGCCG